MAQSRTESAKYVGAAALYVGCALKLQGTNYKEVDVATAVTDMPQGVAAQSGVQNDNIGYLIPGQTVRVVAGAAIAIGAACKVTTAGKFITATKTATGTANIEWIWGWAVSAAAADLDYFEMMYWPTEIEEG